MPTVLHSLANQRQHIRRAEVTMIAGQPEAGRSLIALWHAVKWVTEHGLRGIYFSADSAELGQAARALAMKVQNLSASQAEVLLEDEDEWAIQQMEGLNNLSWSFEDDLSYENINEEVEAFVELWGDTPDFIIVDNLTDVEGQADDEFATLRRAMKALVQLARATDAAVIALHHTSEDPKYDGDPCPPRSSIFGKVSQKPALVFTCSNKGSRRPLACVKNRFGPSDKSGRTATWLLLDTTTLHYMEI
jgi:KaiC/GvpD/RAD55 family RecA-like ATPase